MNQKHKIEDIIEQGAMVMREKGYHNTGISDILVATGIPKGSFYNFFKNKENFGVKILEYYGDLMLHHIRRYTQNKNLSPLERLRQFYLFTIEVNQNEAFRKGCLINNLSTELGGISEQLAKASDHQFNRLVNELAKCVAEGQANGEINNRFEAEEIAQFLHSSFFGSLSRMKMTRNEAPMELNLRMIMDFLKFTR